MALQSTIALATVTLQASTPTVTFSGIPNTYRDLILVVRVFQPAIAVIGCTFNADSASNYSWVNMRGNGSNAASGSGTLAYSPIFYAGNPINGVGIVQIMDYSATDKHKTTLVTDTTDNNAAGAIATRWARLDPISTVSVASVGSTFSAGSTFSLYGRIA